MPAGGFQLHATWDEIARFVAETRERHSLTVVFEYFFPTYQAVLYTPDEHQSSQIPEHVIPNRIQLGLGRPRLRIRPGEDFEDLNPDWLAIEVGRKRAQGLEQSTFGWTTRKKALASLWKQVTGELIARTSAGVWVSNPRERTKQFYPDMRYSSQARELLAEGVKLLAYSSTTNEVTIDEPAVGTSSD